MDRIEAIRGGNVIYIVIGILVLSWISVRWCADSWFAAGHACHGFPFANILGLILTSVCVAGAQYLLLIGWGAVGWSTQVLSETYGLLDGHPLLVASVWSLSVLAILILILGFALKVWHVGYMLTLPDRECLPLEEARAAVRAASRRSGIVRFLYGEAAELVGDYREMVADKAIGEQDKEFLRILAILSVAWVAVLGPAAFVVAYVFLRRLRALAKES